MEKIAREVVFDVEVLDDIDVGVQAESRQFVLNHFIRNRFGVETKQIDVRYAEELMDFIDAAFAEQEIFEKWDISLVGSKGVDVVSGVVITVVGLQEEERISAAIAFLYTLVFAWICKKGGYDAVKPTTTKE